jgi:hypothetical protein
MSGVRKTKLFAEDGEHFVGRVKSNRRLVALQFRHETGADTSQLTKLALGQAGCLATVANVLANTRESRFGNS